jgi:hypothetical protein
MPRTNQPGQRNQPRQRRVNPGKAPWDKLPVIVFHPDPNHVEEPRTDDDVDWEALLDRLDDPTDNHSDQPAVIRHGELVVTRGTFDTATLPARCLWDMEEHPGEEYVVETDGLGRIDVARRGVLTDAHLLDVDVENTGYLQPLAAPKAGTYDTLADYAQALRDHAARTLELAEQYDQLTVDGWDFAPTPPAGSWWPPLRRTQRS